MKKPTKAQLFEQLQFVPFTPEMRAVMRGVNDYKELREHLSEEYHKYQSFKQQKHAYLKHYRGERYAVDTHEINKRIQALETIASLMHYEFYSPNGYWFIRSTK